MVAGLILKDQRVVLLNGALSVAEEVAASRVFVFLQTVHDIEWFVQAADAAQDRCVAVVPRPLCPAAALEARGVPVVPSWAGNQSRFSRVKYAFLQAVLQGIIGPDDRVVCVLGPFGKSHFDTLTIHDLSLSWTEEFPFDPRELIASSAFDTVLAVVDIALDIGALGREGKSVGTCFVIGDTENVKAQSHQTVFNPFRGYVEQERTINNSNVVESLKELAKLDGAFLIREDGVVEAAGRHLDARSVMTGRVKGLGSRHRAAAGITKTTRSVAIVVSESTGRVTIFQNGLIIASLEPVISRRLS